MENTNFENALGNESLVLLSTFSQIDPEAASNATSLNADVYASLNIWEERKRLEEYGIDIFNFYATNLQEHIVKFYTQHYSHMLFVYSEVLDMWVLCVTHYGTPWNGVGVYKYTETEIEENEERIEEIKEQLEEI